MITHHQLHIRALPCRLVLYEETDAPTPGVVGGDVVVAGDVASELVHQDPVEDRGPLPQRALRVTDSGCEVSQGTGRQILGTFHE